MSIAVTSWILTLAAASALPANLGSAEQLPTREASSAQAAYVEDENRDKTGTSRFAESTEKPQAQFFSTNSERETLQAEGMGFEPTTPFGVPDFETPEKHRSAQEMRRAGMEVDRITDNNCQNAAAAQAQLVRINELLCTLDARAHLI